MCSCIALFSGLGVDESLPALWRSVRADGAALCRRACVGNASLALGLSGGGADGLGTAPPAACAALCGAEATVHAYGAAPEQLLVGGARAFHLDQFLDGASGEMAAVVAAVAKADATVFSEAHSDATLPHAYQAWVPNGGKGYDQPMDKGWVQNVADALNFMQLGWTAVSYKN